jgi:hypothetical protein
MAILTVNPFDDDLHRMAKSAAALKGISLREFLEDVLADALGVDRPKGREIFSSKPPKAIHKDATAKNK